MTSAQIALIKNPTVGQTIFNTTTGCLNIYTSTGWVSNCGGSSSAASAWNLSGTTNAATSVDSSIYHLGTITVGSDTSVAGTRDTSAILNVISSNKGILLPRVTLTSPTDSATIPHPSVGLLVYNTGADPDFPTVGYLFWDGSEWKLFASSPAQPGQATLNCVGATLNPAQQIIGGTSLLAGILLQVPYTASNGGTYNGTKLLSSGNPNVTATISNGQLTDGSGVLSFVVSGTPTAAQQAPNGIVFDLSPFLNANPGISGCDSVIVGATLSASMASTAVMGYLQSTTDATNGAKGWALQCNSPDGLWSVRVWVPLSITTVASGSGAPNVQVINNTGSAQTIIWNYDTQYSGDLNNNGIMIVQPNQWGGNNDNYARPNTWTQNPSTGNGGYWGNIGIYDGTNGGPEYRRYTWIPLGANNKIAYEIHVMAAVDNGTTGSGTPSQVKAYIKFDQVTAL